jgi:hypothetical protein
MSQTYYDWPGYNFNNNQDTNPLTSDYKNSLVGKVKKFEDKGLVQSALYNPVTKDIHVTSDKVERFDKNDWSQWPKVLNSARYAELKQLSAAGKISEDKSQYGFVYPEFQDEMLRFAEKFKTHGAAAITSTEFPQITVTTFSQALINKQQLVAQKYNLLNLPDKLQVQDTVNIVFPEYNNTNPSSVRVGYKENEPIDTAGFGAFTQTNVSLKKAGAGLAFTEEYYMRQFSVDIQALLTQKIALDFATARYSRIISKLNTMTSLATTQTAPSWSLFSAANIMSTNRPYLDVAAARAAVNTSDRLAVVDTIVTNEKNYYDYISNTWTAGAFTPTNAIAPDLNQIINRPGQIPWLNQWIINEDISNGNAFVFDHRFLLDVEGPRKTQQINTYNPDQTLFLQKEWFDIVTPSLRSNWGRKLTGI